MALQDNNECGLNNLCVLPQYRHKHIGARLLEDAYIKAKELGCKKMSIGIVEENTILRKWYEDKGCIPPILLPPKTVILFIMPGGGGQLRSDTKGDY